MNMHHLRGVVFLIMLCNLFVQASAQNESSQLIHLKTIEGGMASALYQMGSDSSYVLLLPFPGVNIEPGVFSPQSSFAPEMNYMVLLYNSDFSWEGYFEINMPSSFLQPLHRQGDSWFFNSSVVAGETNVFESNPPLSDEYPSNLLSSSGVLEYNSAENTLDFPLHCQCYGVGDFNLNMPFPFFVNSGDARGQKFNNRFFGAYMNDGHIITTKYLINQIELNGEEIIEIEDGVWGSVWIKVDPLTGNYITVPMYENTGSVLNHALFPSEDGEYIYRTGVLRGSNLQLSADGSSWEGSPVDSMYYAFILKESLNGEMEWMHPIYAYQNTQGDSVSFITEMESLGVIELDDYTFLGHSTRMNLTSEDSLVYRDVFGNTDTFSYSTSGEGANLAYGSYSIYRFNEIGEADSWLEYPLLNTEPNHPMNQSDQQYPYLFEVGNLMAWTHNYIASNDTTIYYIKRNFNDEIDSTSVDLPAGKGAYIAWINTDLEVVDVLNIPFEGDYFFGVSIHHVSLFSSDTLLIQGNMFSPSGVTTSLDPSEQANEETYAGFNTFLGFYSTPEILGDNFYLENSQVDLFSVYPNPATEKLVVEMTKPIDANFSLMDITGKRLLDGRIPKNSKQFVIDVNGFNSGVYLLLVESDGFFQTRKIMLE